MGRLRSCGWRWATAIIFLWSLGACGGHRPGGTSPFPIKITLSPGTTSSVQLGNFILFSATAQNETNNNLSTTFTFASSDTSILNISPGGVGCAGRWDAGFTTCTPEGTGMVEVTASALGATSTPTTVFVHPPIDHITVTGILPEGLPIQEPCLSQGQTMRVEAHAFSQGSDITATVGPFLWTANNANVVKLTPFVNPPDTIATNQATATASTPGITQIYASASGVSSSSFQQPDLVNNPAVIFDFFETCPIQNVTLELGRAGSQQTDFSTTKGSTETVVATVTDVMGNSSLPNTSNGIVLSKIPLTWTASRPAVVATGTGCTQSCSLTTPAPGAGSVTASCSPPTCNIGFPDSPAVLSSAACATYIHAQSPQITSCQPFIPLPVYATSSISGVVTGTTSSFNVIATSLGCSGEPPASCGTAIYSLSTSKAETGNPTPMPTAPNSLLFDPLGDKMYMGSDFGAQTINPANLGTANSAFSSLGTITGKVLATSSNGNVAVFSDTVHNPNQAYIVNASTTSSTAAALNISGAVAAAFSRDGLKTFIIGCVTTFPAPCTSTAGNALYVYSSLQALQPPISLPVSGKQIALSTNDAFVYLSGDLTGTNPTLVTYNTCDNQVATSLALSAPPVALRALPDGVHFIALESDGTLDYITAAITGIPVATIAQPATSLCPMTVVNTKQPLNLGQGTIQPVNFFVSADGTLIYVAATDRSSILVYDLATSSVSGIPLAGNATPLTADMTADAGTIVIAGSDGLMHQVSTALGGSDMVQLAFPNLPNFLNPFCTMNPTSGACTLDFIAPKP